MKEKTDLNTLSGDLMGYIGQKLESKKVVLVCKRFLNFFDPQPQRNQRLSIKLLEQVARGEQDKVEKILKINPELLLEKGSVTDYSGRRFKIVSAFQLAIWALDVKYMAPMMIHCLPKNEGGEKIRKELLCQFNEVVTKGVTYELKGKTVTENHYDFAIINELNDYIEHHQNRTSDERKNHWCKKVGGAQCLVPAHVAQHYCDPTELFHPKPPLFTKTKFSRVLQFQNYEKEEPSLDDWFPSLNATSGLGVDFAMMRGMSELPMIAITPPERRPIWAAKDLTAITVLREVRTIKDLNSLKMQLETPLEKFNMELDSNFGLS